MIKENRSLRKRLKNGEMILGVWNSIPSATLINIVGLSGVDFVIIDAEHGPISMETAEDLVRAADATGISSLIRIPANEPHLILQALDIGACGIQVPHIVTAKDARMVVKSAKYHPEGERGFSPFTRAGNYGISIDGYTRKANQQTVVVVNIEGRQGLDNIEEIAKIRGIDVIFIGPYDLSQSLGKPGKVKDPQVIKAIRRGVAIAKKHNIACGSFACDRPYLELLIECGVRYLTYMVDAALIAQAYKDICNFFNICKDKIDAHR